MNKDVSKLIRQLKRVPGVTVGNGTHPKVSYNGDWVCSLPRTPSDHRWLANTLAQLKQAGVPLDYEEKRAANGQSPPPLPDIKKEESVATLAVKNGQMQQLFDRADKLAAKVEKQYDLKVRADRNTGYGLTVHLEQAMLAYSAETGKEIPHRNYSNRDVNDKPQMAHFAAKLIGSYANSARGGSSKVESVSSTSMRIMDFAEAAWKWLASHDYRFPVTEDEIDEALEEDNVVPLHDPEAVDGAVLTDGQKWLPSRPVDEDLHLRVLAKLAAGGTPADEAIALAKEVRDASR